LLDIKKQKEEKGAYNYSKFVQLWVIQKTQTFQNYTIFRAAHNSGRHTYVYRTLTGSVTDSFKGRSGFSHVEKAWW